VTRTQQAEVPMIKACELRLVETLDDRQHRRVDKTDIGIGVAEPSSLQKMPLSRHFLSEPTPGLEPGTPSLRVAHLQGNCNTYGRLCAVR
jgi:hypothetical protein